MFSNSSFKGFLPILIGIIFVKSASGIKVVQPDEFRCFKGEGLYPFQSSKECHKFFSCMIQGVMAQVATCPQGEIFDSLDRVCRKKEIAQCEIVHCTRNGSIVEDPKNLNSYFLCERGLARRVKCDPPGTYFDREVGICNRRIQSKDGYYFIPNQLTNSLLINEESSTISSVKLNPKPSEKFKVESLEVVNDTDKLYTSNTNYSSNETVKGSSFQGEFNYTGFMLLVMSLLVLFLLVGFFGFFIKLYLIPPACDSPTNPMPPPYDNIDIPSIVATAPPAYVFDDNSHPQQEKVEKEEDVEDQNEYSGKSNEIPEEDCQSSSQMNPAEKFVPFSVEYESSKSFDELGNDLDSVKVSRPSGRRDPQVEDDDDFDDSDSYEESDEDTQLLADRSHLNWPPPTTKPSYLSYKNGGGFSGSRYYKPPTTTPTTTTTTTRPPPTQPPLSYSQFKWQNFGTRQAVDHYRRTTGSEREHFGPSHSTRHYNGHHARGSNRHQSQPTWSSGSNSYGGNSYNRRSAQPLTPEAATRDAIDHALRVSREGSCLVPKTRLVRVQEFYPHPGKTYVPACTILHQCSDDTGCCRNDDLTCSPKSTQRVELSFYTMDNSGGSSVERLVFYNHTECECRDKMDDLMPRDSVPSSPVPPYSHGGGHDIDLDLGEVGGSRRNPHCKCPSGFTERILRDGSCSCDCFDKQKECLRLKRGKDFFSMTDKWCVKSGRCEVPECSYGQYMSVLGSCPRRKDRFGHAGSHWDHRYLST